MSTPRKNSTSSTDTSTKAWHDRAASNLDSWADGYNPRSGRAAAVWKKHRDQLEPLIAAAPAAGVTEARRIASAVLELLAWALPLVDDFDEALSEDSLQRFVRANPNGIGDGALSNVRARVRRVLKTRSSGRSTTTATEDGSARTTEREDTRTVGTKTARLYTPDGWAKLTMAAEKDAALAAALAVPITTTAAEWTHASEVAAKLGILLTKSQVRRTQHVRALSHPMREPLSEALHALAATRASATEAAPLLPVVDEHAYRTILRGEPRRALTPRDREPAADFECTAAEPRHRAGSPAPKNDTVPDPRALGGPSMTSAHRPAPDANAPPSRKPRRKPSARAMRLAVAAVNAERETRAASLPRTMQTYIREIYVPLEPARQSWERIKDAVEETLAASAVRGDDSMRKHVTHLAYFFHWARTVGLPLLPETLTRTNVSRYETQVLVDAGRSTRQTRRSRLMAMADQIHPDQAPVKGPPLAHRTVAPPYTSAEMAIIRRVAQVQPSELLIRQMCLLVGLGAGAGIDSTDLKRLRDSDVIDHGPGTGIEIHVTNLRRSKDNTENRNHRTVWVLREYEDLVRIGIAGAKRGQLLLGRDADRANVATSVFSRAVFSKEVPDLAQSRLRSTWLASHLQRTTPLNVLLQAAGLATARSLVELLEHVPPSTDPHLLR